MAVDLDVEYRCWRLKLDTVTVSGRLKPEATARAELEQETPPGE